MVKSLIDMSLKLGQTSVNVITHGILSAEIMISLITDARVMMS